jgi:hypothetical protein
MKEVQNEHQVLARTIERQIPLGRFKHGWKDTIKMGL